MKTSHVLLSAVAVVTLTGMIATDVLLKQQYDKIDWSDPYQDYEKKPLPPARHVVIASAPVAEVVLETSRVSQALLLPAMAQSYQTHQRGDTLFIDFTMNYDGGLRNPRNDVDRELPAGLVLRLPDLQSLRVSNGRLTLGKRTADGLVIALENTRLRTNGLVVNGFMTLTGSRNSFAVLGADRYSTLR